MSRPGPAPTWPRSSPLWARVETALVPPSMKRRTSCRYMSTATCRKASCWRGASSSKEERRLRAGTRGQRRLRAESPQTSRGPGGQQRRQPPLGPLGPVTCRRRPAAASAGGRGPGGGACGPGRLLQRGGGRQRAGTAPRGQGPQAGGGAWAGALGASLRPLGQAVAEVSVSLQEDKLAKTSF